MESLTPNQKGGIMNNTLEEFVERCIKDLGPRMTGLLFYGSSSRSESNIFSDYDLILTTENHDLELIAKVREILEQTTIIVDLTIVFQSEIPPNSDYFRSVNHGSYFLELLKRASVLYGENIFLKISKPSQRSLEASLFEKIAEYTQACRRNFIEANRGKNPSLNYQMNKRVIKAAHDLLWLSGEIEDTDSKCITMLKEKFSSLLSEEEWGFLSDVSNPENADAFTSNFSRQFFCLRLSVMEKIYVAAQQLVFPLL